jgi:hypothetical protein
MQVVDVISATCQYRLLCRQLATSLQTGYAELVVADN